MKDDMIILPDRQAVLDTIGLEGKQCVEVGTYKGGFASDMLARNPAKLILIDPWRHQDENLYPDDIANEKDSEFERIFSAVNTSLGRDPRVEIIRGMSFPTSTRFDDATIDLVYIDAAHTFESVLCDMSTWFHKVKPGGWLCGHDYTAGPSGEFDYPGVRCAVKAFLGITGNKLSLLTREPWASWGIRRPERKAVITICVGDGYRRMAEITHPTMQRYAAKIGAQFVVLRECTVANASTHFEKFALFDVLSRYDRVIYMDTDMLVRSDCPDLFSIVDRKELGLYDESKLATIEEREVHKGTMNEACELYGEYVDHKDKFYNTGLIVASNAHRNVFSRPSTQIDMDYREQPLLNIRIAKSGFKVRDLGHEFNRMPYLDGRVGHRLESYVIHYAGGDASNMASDVESWSKM